MADTRIAAGEVELTQVADAFNHLHIAPGLRPRPIRWLVLSQFCLQSAMNGVQWILFANRSDQSTVFFGMTKLQLDWLSMVFYLAIPTTAVLGVVWLDKYGVKSSVTIASVLNLIGGLLKIVAALWSRNFGTLLLSSILPALAQAFFLPVPAALSCVWFADDERTLATMLASIATPCGGAVGLLLAPVFVNAERQDVHAFVSLFIAVTALNVLDTTLIVFAIPAAPSHPPSESARIRREVTAQQPTVALGDRVRKVVAEVLPYLRQPRTVALVLGCGTSIGCMWSVSTLLAQLLQPFGVSQAVVGWTGFFNVFLAVPFGMAVSRYVDRERVYKAPLLVLCAAVVGTLGLLTLLFVVQPTQGVAIYATALVVALGSPHNAILPIALEAAAETTFPMNENVCGALVVSVAGAIAVVIVSTLAQVLAASPDPRRSAVAAWVCIVAISVFAFVLVLLGHVDLKRKQSSGAAAPEHAARRPSYVAPAGDSASLDQPLVTPSTIVVGAARRQRSDTADEK